MRRGARLATVERTKHQRAAEQTQRARRLRQRNALFRRQRQTVIIGGRGRADVAARCGQCLQDRHRHLDRLLGERRLRIACHHQQLQPRRASGGERHRCGVFVSMKRRHGGRQQSQCRRRAKRRSLQPGNDAREQRIHFGRKGDDQRQHFCFRQKRRARKRRQRLVRRLRMREHRRKLPAPTRLAAGPARLLEQCRPRRRLIRRRVGQFGQGRQRDGAQRQRSDRSCIGGQFVALHKIASVVFEADDAAEQRRPSRVEIETGATNSQVDGAQRQKHRQVRARQVDSPRPRKHAAQRQARQ